MRHTQGPRGERHRVRCTLPAEPHPPSPVRLRLPHPPGGPQPPPPRAAAQRDAAAQPVLPTGPAHPPPRAGRHASALQRPLLHHLPVRQRAAPVPQEQPGTDLHRPARLPDSAGGVPAAGGAAAHEEALQHRGALSQRARHPAALPGLHLQGSGLRGEGEKRVYTPYDLSRIVYVLRMTYDLYPHYVSVSHPLIEAHRAERDRRCSGDPLGYQQSTRGQRGGERQQGRGCTGGAGPQGDAGHAARRPHRTRGGGEWAGHTRSGCVSVAAARADRPAAQGRHGSSADCPPALRPPLAGDCEQDRAGTASGPRRVGPAAERGGAEGRLLGDRRKAGGDPARPGGGVGVRGV
ncbi:hypothetical protein B484DRAFT_91683 [Ochromonadaceae sp. CCMP2298]|nr:hypothetical protein B484DRAFT_91683 [Ochromonadaceae sp. CCMP2298]